jgi:hypothetical protein
VNNSNDRAWFHNIIRAAIGSELILAGPSGTKQKSIAFILTAVLSFVSPAQCQTFNGTPERALDVLIHELQLGTLETQYVSPQLLQVLYAQTGGSLRYPALYALGPPITLQSVNFTKLPLGRVNVLDVQFQSVKLRFVLAGFDNGILTDFSWHAIGPGTTPSPSPIPSIQGGRDPSGGNAPTSTSDGCKLYANLCP